jgi:hypothetical protein
MTILEDMRKRAASLCDLNSRLPLINRRGKVTPIYVFTAEEVRALIIYVDKLLQEKNELGSGKVIETDKGKIRY